MQQYIEFFTNHPILTAIWVVLFIMLIASWVKSMFSAVKQITPTELTLQVNRHNAQVVDIRAEADFSKGHITSARNISLAEIEKGHAKHMLEKVLTFEANYPMPSPS